MQKIAVMTRTYSIDCSHSGTAPGDGGDGSARGGGGGGRGRDGGGCRRRQNSGRRSAADIDHRLY